jgi:hypothetical protein
LVWIIVSSSAVFAGNNWFVAKIVSLTSEAKDEYRLELIQYTAANGGATNVPPAHLVIHLRFNERLFTRSCPDCPTKEKYLAAILSLKQQLAVGTKFPFGIVSAGFEPIQGKKGEVRSNALCILKDSHHHDIVYSFAGPSQ